MTVTIEKSWRNVLKAEFNKPYFTQLAKTVKEAYAKETVFPSQTLIFNAFKHCPFDKVKVVILGQDPYHGHKQAMGLSFSVPKNETTPPSLQNIYKEIRSDIGTPIPPTGDLTRWADQGVLLLNATLTVQADAPGSHQGLGWEQFTDFVIKTISDKKEQVVFLLWGNFAKEKIPLIDQSKHLILTAPHPSPLSAHRGFFGCKHFSKTNQYLEQHDKDKIKW